MPDSTKAKYQAALGAYASFVYPENDEQRGYAVLAYANATGGGDYIEELARYASAPGGTLSGARFRLADDLLRRANAHYHAHLTANPPKEPTT
jgi:hypothetical protein